MRIPRGAVNPQAKRKLQTTRRVRVKMDFVVEFDTDLDGLPRGGLCGPVWPSVVAVGLRKLVEEMDKNGVEGPRPSAVLGAANVETSLDYRKKKTKG